MSERQHILDEHGRVVDEKNGRIKTLEAQLRDVAYGTKQHNIASSGQSLIIVSRFLHLRQNLRPIPSLSGWKEGKMYLRYTSESVS